ncbi:cryptochrome/photolyase family protein [Haliea sp. E1-2-M8]|uniref:cryptochrome/photolyase family protein n=1 Tax=Haliea sp. E1-2-M8 TaxID=3064706 RepID=UPI002716DE21|nr:cryptochrome/photolyase family protein [Haliea sp. E1-2-M8]MDO8860601.1 cryptochrome/photolyase family protein [Haliea sp. E1-2-M8]
MSDSALILVLGDQLSLANPALIAADPCRDLVVLAEVAEEAGYVPHNRHKIALIFSAMRHFRDQLRQRGFQVRYFSFGDGQPTLQAALAQALEEVPCGAVRVCEPGEYRLRQAMTGWKEALGVPVAVLEDSRYLASHAEFRAWAKGRKQLRMEYFYRDMRRKHGILLEVDGQPAGDRWNFDQENRVGWRGQETIPARRQLLQDDCTQAVLAEVAAAFPDNPGELEQFNYACTAAEARLEFDWFCRHALPGFGSFQDALVEESPWVFHSKISMYLNIGLLEPLPLCEQVEQAFRDGDCSLAAAEGFIRQILGWREYVRGVYWLTMPEYKTRNTFAASEPLPEFFWTGETGLRCLQQALRQTLDLGYAHHIQRLMVIGNFALLAGLDVEAVCDWYLAVYVDAFEWVELPNTLGMALHADNGLIASKPYAASGKYIQRQGNHCKECQYSPAKMTGEGACPFNALYWRFIDRHLDYLAANPRMGLITANWRKRAPAERKAITDWADRSLALLLAGASPRHQ